MVEEGHIAGAGRRRRVRFRHAHRADRTRRHRRARHLPAVAERLGATSCSRCRRRYATRGAQTSRQKPARGSINTMRAVVRAGWRQPPPEPALAERLILRLVNVAMACLREGVVRNAAAVDLGLVYGTGFAPFRGGPLGYARTLGERQLHHSLYRLAAQHGTGFIPIPAGPNRFVARRRLRPRAMELGADANLFDLFFGRVGAHAARPGLPPVRAGRLGGMSPGPRPRCAWRATAPRSHAKI